MTQTTDFLIAGAGIIGLSIAREIKKIFPDAKIAVWEKEPRVGMHASGRNSGVLHCGIYYGSDTWKARFCSVGSARMKEFASEHEIRCQTVGKVIVAGGPEDVPGLDKLMDNARKNSIRAERLDGEDLRRVEPHVNHAYGGIFCPDTAVIDSIAVLNKLVELLSNQGVEFRFEQRAVDIHQKERSVMTTDGRISYGFFINCAGAYADVIAKKFGLARDYALLPFKGTYYKLNPERAGLIKANIYPVPDLFLPFLGVHFTRGIQGDVYVGPTALPALGRENYGWVNGMDGREGISFLFQNLMMYLKNSQNFRRLVHEEVRKFSKSRYAERARRLVPSLGDHDLLPSAKVGIRPQLVNIRKNRLEMDYIFEETDHSLHVLNAISPAFTSAFSFAELLAGRIEEKRSARSRAALKLGTKQ